jgi:carboxyl-terminal processing protease
MTTGEYGGIGALITRTGDGICISEPYEGLPAQKNGLKAGDIILEIDGIKTDKMTVSDASSRLKGTPNTEIRLKIKRYGEKKEILKKFLREKILIHPISYVNEAAPGTGYILLNDFTEQASLEFKNAVKELISKHQIKSLIIDLRNNGGGLIDEAVKIMGYFVPKGTEIVSTRGKSIYASHTYKTTVEPIFPEMKLAVLVNSNSASASEILAGAVQDLDRGIVVGERTFGKGLVQNIRPVSYGGHVKVTTAKYYIPSGRCIQAIDYAQRNEDGSIRSIPDSLIQVFKTRNGRPVKDGGGIIPDTITSDDRKINIAYYIYSQNLYFDFATQYAARHNSIAAPAQFNLTEEEMQAFRNFLKEKKFSYTPQTKKYFDDLYQFSKYEGLDKEAEAEFEALRKKLLPDMESKLKENDAEIRELLSLEIIKRYYYQKGQIEFSHKTDQELKTAISLLQQEKSYNELLTRGI